MGETEMVKSTLLLSVSIKPVRTRVWSEGGLGAGEVSKLVAVPKPTLSMTVL